METGPLYVMFRDALNAELDALGCDLRLAASESTQEGYVLLIDPDGTDVGLIPEQADAATIAAFSTILASHMGRPGVARQLTSPLRAAS